MTAANPIPWNEAGWLDEACAWIDAALAERAIERAGPITQPHIRPWSTVLLVPVAGGRLFFKATTPVFRHEPALTKLLADWRGAEIPPVLAIDAGRCWMLLGDCGEPMRATVQAERSHRPWLAALPQYARLQRAAAGRVPELLATGMLDRRLATLPDQFAALLADEAALLLGQEDGMSADQRARLLALVPAVRELADELAGCGIPETLHHDDFHDGNIFVRDGRIIFADWAESAVAHPFFSLVVALNSAAYQLGLEEDAPELAELRQAYLAEWAGAASPARLERAAVIARGLGMICRALTWHDVNNGVPPELRGNSADAVPGWLLEFLPFAEREGLLGA